MRRTPATLRAAVTACAVATAGAGAGVGVLDVGRERAVQACVSAECGLRCDAWSIVKLHDGRPSGWRMVTVALARSILGPRIVAAGCAAGVPGSHDVRSMFQWRRLSHTAV